jgi:hypothetical protein
VTLEQATAWWSAEKQSRDIARGSGGSGDAIEGLDAEAGAGGGRCPGGGRRREMPRRLDVEGV